MRHRSVLLVFLLLVSLPAAAAVTDAESSPDRVSIEAPAADRQSEPQGAGNVSLHNVSVRGTFSSADVVGNKAPEAFGQYDVAATVRLPWSWYPTSGWGLGTRLMLSAGALCGSGETGLAVSLLPLIAYESQEGRFSLDLGAGGAVLSKDQFGEQDFGSPFQFALTAGFGIAIFKYFGLGYRFLHYSDAGLNGSYTTGADLHMYELFYRF
jgi:hypothetical protein